MTGADSVTSIACFNKSHEQQLQLRRVFCFARTLLQFYARVPLRTLSDPIRPRAAGSTSPSPRGGAARTAQPREALRRSLPCPARPSGRRAENAGGGCRGAARAAAAGVGMLAALPDGDEREMESSEEGGGGAGDERRPERHGSTYHSLYGYRSRR